MEVDLFNSEEWSKATPKQRQDFISWVRVNQAAAKREAIAQAKKQRKLAKPKQISSARVKIKSNNKPSKRVKRRVNVDVKSDAFLSTYEWRKVRMMALKRYGPKCQCCGATPADGAVMNVDHIKPRKLFPELALDVGNLQILCHDCNHGKGNWDTTDWRNNS